MAVIATPSGFQSVRTTRPSDVVIKAGSVTRGGVSTQEQPTPSAEQLVGTASEREAQIAAFRSGGQEEFIRAKTIAQARIEQEAVRTAELEARTQAATLAQARTRAIEQQQVRREEFIQRKDIEGERGIPLTEVVVTDSEGNVIRKASLKERESLREQETALRPSGKEGVVEKLRRARGEVATRATRTEGISEIGLGALGTGLGFISVPIEIGQSVLSPVETGKGVLEAIKAPQETLQSIRLSTATAFQREPSFAIGRAAGEIAVLKAPSVITKLSDVARTRGLVQIPTGAVIAPEISKGQTFPQIAKGQTAGQLLAEFKPAEQFGVTRLRGFTAAPKPFAKETVAGVGTSEFAGVFQAPKVSPRFLRVGGEQKLVSLKLFDTLRPSVTKISPESFELARGVRSEQARLAKAPSTKPTFFEQKDIGKSIIPFIKTEKEAVIPAGTGLKQVERRLFFKFEGRRIPIAEFKTIKESKVIKGKTFTTREVSTISSRGRISRRGVVTPSEVTSLSRAISRPVSKGARLPVSRVRPVQQVSPLQSFVKSQRSISKSTGRPVSKLTSFPSSVTRLSSFKPPTSRTTGRPTGKITGTGIPSRIDTKLPKKKKKALPQFSVELRRFGKFKPIGTGLTKKQALTVGRKRVAETLGATFRLKQTKGKIVPLPSKVAGFRTKFTPTGTLFIEPRKRRLSKRKEVKEIQRAKRRKKKVKGGRK